MVKVSVADTTAEIPEPLETFKVLLATIDCTELSSSKLKPDCSEVLISFIAPTILPFSVVPNEAHLYLFLTNY